MFICEKHLNKPIFLATFMDNSYYAGVPTAGWWVGTNGKKGWTLSWGFCPQPLHWVFDLDPDASWGPFIYIPSAVHLKACKHSWLHFISCFSFVVLCFKRKKDSRCGDSILQSLALCRQRWHEAVALSVIPRLATFLTYLRPRSHLIWLTASEYRTGKK